MTARRILTGVLLLAAPVAADAQLPGTRAPGAPTTLTAEQQAARAIYKEIVEINTADSVGSVTRAAQVVAARFRAAGFPAADVNIVGPANAPAKHNLVVRLRGKTRGKPILLLAHLDVVQALRADWPRDPFVLVEEDGWFYGRGVSDDKSMCAMFIANLLRYKREGWVPERDLILALTADEEGGNSNGVSWLIENRRDLIDAEYAINEGGGGTLQDDKPLFHSIQAAEKVYEDFTFTVKNTGGHSSVPRKDNAIYSLSQALLKVQQYAFPVELNAVTTAFFTQTAKVEMPSLATAMRALVANPADTAAARVISTDPRYASMLRTTCVATMLNGGHAPNALPQTAKANVNCRIAPSSKASQVRATLQRIVNDTAVAIVGERPDRTDGAPAPIHPVLLKATESLTRQMFGDIPVIPTMSTGATDGYRLRNAGIPTYGVSGIFSAPGETNAHGRNEKLRVKSFYDGLAFLYELVKQVAGPGQPVS
ncbi:MAG TPA: peptidase M20 [Gemmatimonas aurantiaca]|uniref:Peptidase M20A family protein n=2 Tax=Gemmatimonas aurantiaca TaxID=173480 RepID=C1A5D0_GEMAT|nr:M20/M25/M40 family metallo-hydrolase [Gemmatimonas aurantiaca]BAH37440.1 peptidase M20A family protein [Gemmatimonas aurantiaca T-27]HCT55856.1 peptidase M20 [Gemmatimonas aurantiaca]